MKLNLNSLDCKRDTQDIVVVYSDGCVWTAAIVSLKELGSHCLVKKERGYVSIRGTQLARRSRWCN
ncbi:hypothetical protein E2C01_045567 [Portunus trituberculatus]|uniref:Uncharacterized protein n=1 Tax=Portunus trituberculatus TaxID=210409 RepID=A0A5B7G2T9_PORTR|nr:hypothetical protein [Portunus trituberculatus]